MTETMLVPFDRLGCPRCKFTFQIGIGLVDYYAPNHH